VDSDRTTVRFRREAEADDGDIAMSAINTGRVSVAAIELDAPV